MSSIVPDSEFSKEFVEKMKNRMAVSYHKYGKIEEAYPHKIDAIASLKKRLLMYAETGNTEYLVDAANFAMIEFMLPSHESAHFKGTDDSGSPGRVCQSGKVTKKSNEDI